MGNKRYKTPDLTLGTIMDGYLLGATGSMTVSPEPK